MKERKKKRSFVVFLSRGKKQSSPFAFIPPSKRFCARRRLSRLSRRRPRREVVKDNVLCQNVVTFFVLRKKKRKKRKRKSRINFNLGYQKKKREFFFCFPASESFKRRRRNNHTHTHDTCLPPPTSSSRRRPTQRVSSRRREDTTSRPLRDDHTLFLCAHHRL